jgi:hypothetical protein
MHRYRKAATLVLGTGWALLGSAVLAAVPASAATAGSATLTSPGGRSLVTSGEASTTFTLSLPSGAACPEDSVHGAVVDSFLVPAGTDVGKVTFTGDGEASVGYFLTNVTGTPMWPVYVAVGTAQIPLLSERFTLHGLRTVNVPVLGPSGLVDPATPQPGVWDAGVASVLNGRTQSYWDVRLTFLPTGSSFTWAVDGAPARAASGGGRTGLVAGALAVVAVVAGGVFTWVRRRKRGAETTPSAPSRGRAERVGSA